MKMTMYYVHGIGEKKESHVNLPAENPQMAYDFFKQNMGDKVTVAGIVPLFDFEYLEASKIVEVN